MRADIRDITTIDGLKKDISKIPANISTVVFSLHGNPNGTFELVTQKSGEDQTKDPFLQLYPVKSTAPLETRTYDVDAPEMRPVWDQFKRLNGERLKKGLLPVEIIWAACYGATCAQRIADLTNSPVKTSNTKMGTFDEQGVSLPFDGGTVMTFRPSLPAPTPRPRPLPRRR